LETGLDDPSTVTFYRIAKTFPPSADEYRTKRQKDGNPPTNADAAIIRAYDGLSAFDSEAGARRQATRFRILGSKVVRFHLPIAGHISWEQTFQPGHYTLTGELAQLAEYLDLEFVIEVL
jgi:hypothetical protein